MGPSWKQHIGKGVARSEGCWDGCLKPFWGVAPLESMAVKYSLTYEDVPVEILDRQIRRLRNKEVTSVKVVWKSQSIEGATWESEVAMEAKYPHLVPSNFVSA